jgi:hypothetical protein
MSKIHAFPLLTIDHFITRETKRLSSNDNDLYDLLPPLSLPHRTAPPHVTGASQLSTGSSSSTSKSPAERNSYTMPPLPLHIHRLPDPTRLFPPSPFSLALIPLSPVSNNLRPAPRRGATDKRRGPFWFSSMIVSQHAFPSFVLPCPAHLLITFFTSSVFPLTLAFISLKRVELGWGGT